MTGSNGEISTAILPYGAEAIRAAAARIRAGEPVAVPTETVYGLAADATNGAAVAAIYQAKGRPTFNPLIVHVRDIAMAHGLAEFSPVAATLAATFWPGPLTLVLPAAAASPVASLVTAGLPTIALRCPAHPAMQALIAAAAVPLAAPSANASGTVSPTTAQHVAATLDGRIAMIIDGGACPTGIESTIVRVLDDRLLLLRPGPVTPDQLQAASGLPVEADQSGAISAPGQLASHYAPGKPVLLDQAVPPADTFMIGFGAVAGDYQLSASADLAEAAARLFDALHAGAAHSSPRIAVATIPHVGLGIAINDRLHRAAA